MNNWQRNIQLKEAAAEIVSKNWGDVLIADKRREDGWPRFFWALRNDMTDALIASTGCFADTAKRHINRAIAEKRKNA